MRSTASGNVSAWGWVLVSVLGCSGESAIVGGNSAEPSGGSGHGGGGPGGSSNGDAVEQQGLARIIQSVERITDAPGRCMPYSLPLDEDGTAACKVFTTSSPASCDCDAANRAPVGPAVRQAIIEQARQQYQCDQESGPLCADLCVCEDLEAAGDDLSRCLDGDSDDSDGWCYVEPALGLGNLRVPCETEPQALVRFNGSAHLNEGEQAYLGCSAASERPVEKRKLGAVCVPSDELNPSFSGFTTSEVVVDEGSTSCASGTCLVHGFQGRVSCPFGSSGDGACSTPGSHERVTVPVAAQLVSRPPSVAATCSCRCAGPGDGPFCTCAEGQECAPLVAQLGLPGDELAGSYCIPRGAAAPSESAATCADAPEQCGDRAF
jgi:hypothetical protein